MKPVHGLKRPHRGVGRTWCGVDPYRKGVVSDTNGQPVTCDACNKRAAVDCPRAQHHKPGTICAVCNREMLAAVPPGHCGNGLQCLAPVSCICLCCQR